MKPTIQELCTTYDGVIHNNYPDYIITRCGEIYSLKRERFLDKTLHKRDAKNINSKCDEMVHLVINGSPKTVSIHRLLATAFILNPDNKDTVNHIDGNPMNNSLDNLEWMTQAENSSHAHSLGLVSGTYTRCMISKINYTEEFVASYNSITEAATALGDDKTIGLIGVVVSSNSKGKTTIYGTPYTSNGYVWRYTDKAKKEYFQEKVTYSTEEITDIEYKPIKGYEEYVVTIDGRVYHSTKEKWLSLTVVDTKDGRLPYVACSLAQGKKYKMFRVAKLVADAFGKSLTKVDFVDGNTLNCHLDNLCEKERGTNSRPVAAYKLLWKDAEVIYAGSTKEVEQITGMRPQAISEVILLNKDTPLSEQYTNTQRPYVRNGYVIRGLSKN